MNIRDILRAFRAAPQPAPTRPPAGEIAKLDVQGAMTSYGKGIEVWDQNRVTRQIGWAALREMPQKNGTLAAAMRSRTNMILRRGWDVVPASEEQADIDIANFVKEATKRLRGDFELDLAELLQAWPYGWALSEKVWGPWSSPEYGDKWIVEALKDKDQESFENGIKVDAFGNITALVQQRPERKEHPPEKFVVMTFQGRSGNPYGLGLYQQCYWHDWFMRTGWKFWATHLERFGSPVVKATVRPGISPTERTTIEGILNTIQTRTGVIVPEGVILEYMEAVRGGRDSYGAYEDEHRQAIITLILGQELTTQVGASGSRALGDVQANQLDQIIDADCVALFAALNEQYVRPLVDVNYAGVQNYPTMSPPIKDDSDLSVLATIIQTLVAVGQPIGTQWVSERFDIPLPEADEEPLKKAAPILPPGFGGSGNETDDKDKKDEEAEPFQQTDDDEGEFWREPELFEDGPSLRRLSKDRKAIVETAEKEARPIFQAMRDKLVAQVIADGTLDRADYARELVADITPLNDLFERQTVLSWMIGADSGVREIRKAGGQVPDARFAADVPDEDAVLRDFRTRVPMSSAQWHRLTAEARLRAFTIGSEQRAAVIKVFHDAILETLNNGLGVRYFESVIALNMAAWTDSPLGVTSNRLSTIFRNAVMTSINQGREAMFDRPMSDPVVAEMYSAIMDGRTTPLCHALDGKIASRAQWRAWHLVPQNHHQCRSVLVPILESQAAEIPGDRLMRELPLVDGKTAAPAAGFGGGG